MSYEKDWKAVVTELNSDSETGLSKDEAQKHLLEQREINTTQHHS